MKKYRNILLLITALILINVGAAVAGYFFSEHIQADSSRAVVLANGQVQLDKMSKNIIDLNIHAERALRDGSPRDFFLEETLEQQRDVQQHFQSLHETIQAFGFGGEIFWDGKRLPLAAPLENSPEALLNQRIQELWPPFAVLIGRMLEHFEQDNMFSLNSNVLFTADYSRLYSELLGQYLGQLQQFYQQSANAWSAGLNGIQIAAIVLNAMIVFFLIFWAFRSLLRLDQKVERAQQETSNIMRTVREGLFLIDGDLIIAGQYSAQLESILGQEHIAGRELGDLLSHVVPAKDYQVTEEFIEQLFNDDVIEELIWQLNPLDKIRVYIRRDERSVPEERFLSFAFARVYDEQENIISVLVRVADITKQTLLEERLERERVQHDAQIELLSSILGMPKASIQGFIRHVHQSCQRINHILMQPSHQPRELNAKAQAIFREAHSLKGEASSLNMRHFVHLAEEMENEVKQIRELPSLTGEDFLALTVILEKILQLNLRVEELFIKMNPTTTHQAWDESDAESQRLADFIQEVATRNQKEVAFHLQGWDKTKRLNEQAQSQLREMLIQLLRNAVVHGIETPEQREARHKNRVGQIRCDIQWDGDGLTVLVQDDGRGIDFARLQEKARAEGLLHSGDSPLETQRKLLNYLFRSGVSTVSVPHEDAGRGVGMDLIRARLHALGGRIAVQSKPGLATAFRLHLPQECAAHAEG